MKSDLVDVFFCILKEEKVEIEWDDEVVIGIVLVVVGYSEDY